MESVSIIVAGGNQCKYCGMERVNETIWYYSQWDSIMANVYAVVAFFCIWDSDRFNSGMSLQKEWSVWKDTP